MDTKYTDEGVKLSAIASGAISAAAWERYQGETMGKVLREAPLTQVPSNQLATAANVPAPAINVDINATLAERGSRYGSFEGHALITQGLKKLMQGTGNWAKLADDQREALEMIAHKIGRILNGDPNYHDSWHDIVGYTKLVADRLAGKVQ